MAVINIEVKIEGSATASAQPVRLVSIAASLSGHASALRSEKPKENPKKIELWDQH
jgi:hypothetical protein